MPRLPVLQRHHLYTIILFVVGSFFSPLAVAARFGIGTDFWLNLLLTIIGYIPGQVHLFFIQVIRNNKTHHRTPEWALRYGLVDGSAIMRHEQRSQWARNYNDRNLDYGYYQNPWEGNRVGPPWTSARDSADNTLRNGDRLWRPEDQSYYSTEREGSSHPAESGGRWHYPANFSDRLPGDATTAKKKKDRWGGQRTHTPNQDRRRGRSLRIDQRGETQQTSIQHIHIPSNPPRNWDLLRKQQRVLVEGASKGILGWGKETGTELHLRRSISI
ncbi:hypothetical protein HD554DRAFT_2174351 [Boletus coccyginus]|nr:hypothetical protein HD554DRAFT_2174351 [Boletus coccyginus]